MFAALRRILWRKGTDLTTDEDEEEKERERDGDGKAEEGWVSSE